MANFVEDRPAGALAPSQELFVEAWQVYRKMVDHDYLFHKGAYGCLHRVLMDEISQPFAFLDVACGDASMSVEALQGTQIRRYFGIDISEQALGLAAERLKSLTCTVTLEARDFADALGDWAEPVDVVWIGLSLHHFLKPGKLEVMRHVRRITAETGRLMIYEDTSPDGEDRAEWLRRWDAQKPVWTAYTEAEWDYVTAHVHASDFPETDSAWRELGEEAGFSRVRDLFASPTGLFRLYCFEA